MMKTHQEIFRQRCKSAIKSMTDATDFLLRYPDKWHTYSTDYETVETVCALSNLGIAKLNQYDQFALKSEENARRFLRSRS